MSCGSNIPDCLPCQDCPPVVTTPIPNCPQGEKCEEIDGADCILYTGPNLPALDIKDKDRLTTILTKLHKVVNILKGVNGVNMQTYTATSTTVNPLVVTYLALGPIYNSTSGAVSSASTITVGSTTGLQVGMTVEVVSGTGVFASGTVVTSIVNATTFTVSTAPTTPLTGTANVIRATGTEHQIFTVTVVQNIPQSFKAFGGSPVIVSGTGTVI